jgi:BirA family biotin operon repressor/biotin-[acetyl-CoA-carboxylase] ligase
MLGAVTVAEMLEESRAEDVTIKWPNDVCLNGRKVSGVLPEAVWESDNLRGVALGMGINVRVDFAGHEFKQKATSLEYEMDARFD